MTLFETAAGWKAKKRTREEYERRETFGYRELASRGVQEK